MVDNGTRAGGVAAGAAPPAGGGRMPPAGAVAEPARDAMAALADVIAVDVGTQAVCTVGGKAPPAPVENKRIPPVGAIAESARVVKAALADVNVTDGGILAVSAATGAVLRATAGDKPMPLTGIDAEDGRDLRAALAAASGAVVTAAPRAAAEDKHTPLTGALADRARDVSPALAALNAHLAAAPERAEAAVKVEPLVAEAGVGVPGARSSTSVGSPSQVSAKGIHLQDLERSTKAVAPVLNSGGMTVYASNAATAACGVGISEEAGEPAAKDYRAVCRSEYAAEPCKGVQDIADSADARVRTVLDFGDAAPSVNGSEAVVAPASISRNGAADPIRSVSASDVPRDVFRTIGRVAVHLYAPDMTSGPGASPRSPAGTHARVEEFCKQLGLPVLGAHPVSRAMRWLTTVARKDRGLAWSAKPVNGPGEQYVVSISVWAGVSDGEEVIRGSDASRQVLWHLRRFREDAMVNGDQRVSTCGFVGCQDVCSVGVADKAQFRLDRVFERCALPKLPDAREGKSALGCLSILPDESLENIALQLDPKSLMSFGSTCRVLHRLTAGFVVGLDLRLYPHQQAAISCMIARERNGKKQIPAPLYAKLPQVETGSGFHVNVDDGSVTKGEVERWVEDCRGGLYCDEPGLGKTITALALVLKTLGQQAKPPPGYHGTVEEEKEWSSESDDEDEDDWRHGRTSEDFDDIPLSVLSANARGVGRRKLKKNKREERLRQARRGLRKLYYCPPRADRFQAFGMDELATSGGRRGAQPARRSIKRPDFLGAKKGEGSLPSVGLRDVPIYLSGATLCVVPDALVKHWQNQIQQHVHRTTLRVLTIRKEAEVPQAVDLAFDFDFVIVNFTTLSAVSKKLRCDAPPLLCVRFLRVLMDEGHKLGASASSITDFSQVSKLLRAERRWILTGTPAANVLATDVRTLLPLLRFIRDEAFGLDDHAWLRVIQKPYEMHRPDALNILDKLFDRVVIRSSKDNIDVIPNCIVTDVYLNFSKEAAECYNDLVLVGLRNLILTDWHRATHPESLLNPKNSRECIEMLENLRSSCCFGGVIRLEFDRVDIGDSLDMLHEYGLQTRQGVLEDVRDEDKYLHVPLKSNWYSHSFYATSKNPEHLSLTEMESTGRASITPNLIDNRDDRMSGVVSRGAEDGEGEDEQPLTFPRKHVGKASDSRIEFRGVMKKIGEQLIKGCNCATCGSYCRLPMLSTCGHTVCLDCFSSSKLGCTVPSCGHMYTVDGKGVAKDVQELQPSVHSEEWKPDWESSVSAKMDYLLMRLDQIPVRSVLENGRWKKKRPKVIVYTQFHMHRLLLSLVFNGSEKYRDRYVELFVNEAEVDTTFLGGSRLKKETTAERLGRLLDKFEFDDEKQVLLIETVHSSVGLDLSFVEYIFLLEPVWNTALEKQVIARAHRIGAKETVRVERLAMRGSVEEFILREGMTNSEGSGVSSQKKDLEAMRRASILLELKSVSAGPPVKAENAKPEDAKADDAKSISSVEIITETKGIESTSGDDQAKPRIPEKVVVPTVTISCDEVAPTSDPSPAIQSNPKRMHPQSKLQDEVDRSKRRGRFSTSPIEAAGGSLSLFSSSSNTNTECNAHSGEEDCYGENKTTGTISPGSLHDRKRVRFC